MSYAVQNNPARILSVPEQKSGRGRPRSFDAANVVRAARTVFWRDGYSATSLENLSNVSRLHKPSLYGSFGGKRGLYIAALDSYLDEAKDLLAAALSRPTLREALQAFYASDIEVFLGERAEGRGCFLISTAVMEAPEDPELAERSRAALDGIGAALRSRFARALVERELVAGADPDTLAALAVATHVSLAVKARAGQQREDLERFVRLFIDHVAPASTKSLVHITLIVRDYDEAIAWYTGKLGFTLIEDIYQREQDKRWVLVAPPGAGENATALLLARASTPEQEAFIGNQAGGRAFLFLRTDDLWRDFSDLTAKGVRFVRPPVEQHYGTVAVFEDLYGNLWDLVQFAARGSA